MQKMVNLRNLGFAVFGAFMWICCKGAEGNIATNPFFAEPIQNVTAIKGRNATISCHVRDLGKYKVAWVHVDRKMVLAIHDKVTTRIPRFGVSFDGDKSTWRLHIYNVQEDDKGRYMCQLNTDPMQAQIGLLEVVVPPTIDDAMSSPSTISVSENGEVTLQCHAKGFPSPSVEWRREDNAAIRLRNNRGSVPKVEGTKLHLKTVTRKSMAAYLCIANNGIPPIVSKRITLEVEFPPTVAAAESLISSPMGHTVELRCTAEAYPRAMYYWTKNGSMVHDHSKYDTQTKTRYPYETDMVLKIKNVTAEDLDVYACLAKNSLGEEHASIRLIQYGRSTKDVWHQTHSSSRASKSEVQLQSAPPSSSSMAAKHEPASVTINTSSAAHCQALTLLLIIGLAVCLGWAANSTSQLHPASSNSTTLERKTMSRQKEKALPNFYPESPPTLQLLKWHKEDD